MNDPNFFVNEQIKALNALLELAQFGIRKYDAEVIHLSMERLDMIEEMKQLIDIMDESWKKGIEARIKQIEVQMMTLAKERNLF